MRIALVAHNALGALRGGAGRHIGGVERQVALMAKWFARRGHAVSVLVWDEGQGGDIEVDGVRVLAICRREAGWPGVRFFYPRWWRLRDALARADAEIYYQNGAEYVTGQVAAWCARRRCAMVFSAASDHDCAADLPDLPSRRERWLYRWGLEHASGVIVQTEAQQTALATHFGTASSVFPMGAIDPLGGAAVPLGREQWQRFHVCWVGRISPEKRPEWLLELAAKAPELNFEVVGGGDGSDPYVTRLRGEARAQPNITWHGRLAPDRVPAVYRRCAALVCTSSYEGFPNTFLEAWAHGLPVVSTVDPDGLLERRQIGCAATTPAAIVAELERLRRDFSAWSASSERARAYFLDTHATDVAFGRFERYFEGLLEGRAASG